MSVCPKERHFPEHTYYKLTNCGLFPTAYFSERFSERVTKSPWNNSDNTNVCDWLVAQTYLRKRRDSLVNFWSSMFCQPHRADHLRMKHKDTTGANRETRFSVDWGRSSTGGANKTWRVSTCSSVHREYSLWVRGHGTFGYSRVCTLVAEWQVGAFQTGYSWPICCFGWQS